MQYLVSHSVSGDMQNTKEIMGHTSFAFSPLASANLKVSLVSFTYCYSQGKVENMY